jgi:hypothetical protein
MLAAHAAALWAVVSVLGWVIPMSLRMIGRSSERLCGVPAASVPTDQL